MEDWRSKDITGGHVVGSFRYIPKDIFLYILGRLPIKSRGRFRCVSKQWYSWISYDSPRRFKLLIRKIKANISILVLGEGFEVEAISFYSIDQNRKLEKNTKNISECDHKDDWFEVRCHILGSCNGLVLVKVKTGFYLWNPSTGYRSKKLSNPKLGHLFHDKYLDGLKGSPLGLCFDSNNGDYKVLLAVYHRTQGQFLMIGSFKNGTWTHVNFPYLIDSISQGPVLNDHLHWLANKKANSRQIVCFVPNKDKLLHVPLPERPGDDSCVRILCVLDGCLCVVYNVRDDDGRCKFEILVMKEYGVKESWAILFKIDLGVDRCSYLEPLFYTEDKEMVLVNVQYKNACDIRAYDRNGKFCCDVKTLFDSWRKKWTIIVYEETFVNPAW